MAKIIDQWIDPEQHAVRVIIEDEHGVRHAITHYLDQRKDCPACGRHVILGPDNNTDIDAENEAAIKEIDDRAGRLKAHAVRRKVRIGNGPSSKS